MKISKLYCDKGGFKNIQFNLKGLNIIYADVKTRIAEGKNSHDLGKTKLSELIDYLLLKKVSDRKKHFLFKIKNKTTGKSIFNDYCFFLEVLLNSGQFLTIKRGVENNTRISFAISEARNKDFQPPLEWEIENYPIDKAKDKLAEYLAFDFFRRKSYDYRKAISYCLRTPPSDYADVYQLSKFAGGRDLYWKPFMFDLLGFNGSLLFDKYENDHKKKEIAEFIEKLKKEYSIRVEDRDDIVAQISLIEGKANQRERQIDNFNFYDQDKELIENGIEDIETRISDLNSSSYSLNFELSRLRKSIGNKFAFDLEKVDKVFEEAELYFPEQLKEDYESLISFNNKLTSERNKLLKSTLMQKEKELESVNSDLLSFNMKKEELLSFIQDTDSFKKFKKYQKELVKIEGQLFILREKKNFIDKIIEKEAESEELSKEIDETVKEIRKLYQQTENNKRYTIIRKRFSSFYDKVMNEDARLSWSLNSQNNVDFIPPKVHSRLGEDKETAKDEGNTYKKLLCVAFDLSILVAYNNESYFRFVYHDDVLSQQGHGIKKRLLELVHLITNKFDIQYILSVIKADLPLDDEDMITYFSDDEIVLRLNDEDPSGTLFGFEF